MKSNTVNDVLEYLPTGNRSCYYQQVYSWCKNRLTAWLVCYEICGAGLFLYFLCFFFVIDAKLERCPRYKLYLINYDFFSYCSSCLYPLCIWILQKKLTGSSSVCVGTCWMVHVLTCNKVIYSDFDQIHWVFTVRISFKFLLLKSGLLPFRVFFN